MPSFGGSAATPGTPEWWKKNKNKATYVERQGYQVEGVPGYFDKNGRPMDGAMSEKDLVFRTESDKPQGLFPQLDPKKNYEKAKVAVGLGPDQQRAQEVYQEGQTLFTAKQYAKAAKKYQEACQRWPNSTLERQSLYQLGNSYFFDDRYQDARETYVELLEKYPNSPQVDGVVERLWSIAEYWEKHDQKEHHWAATPNFTDETRPWFDTQGFARKTYENIQLYDPTGPRADDAIMAMAGMYFRKGQYGEADHYYQLLRQQYPRSEYQFEAHLLGLQTKLRKYQGPEYDGAPLEEAKVLAKQLRTQFAGRLSADEGERLAQTQAEVNQAIVQRDMAMASHYENTGHYGAARIYYGEVMKKYPESQLASAARERLSAIADEPALPEEPAKWLIEMFPENPERTRVARVPELRDSRGGDQSPDKKDEEGTTLFR
ncbi:tol-pal system protein YbgF [Aeoliella mucimassa]|uniref:Tol-pal system protein YbgF n=2 Tax=Aeoliella mucimassa TaxID=2527972 RepID=A0A518AVN2_9BACT|nr:tol-pal system protein YbgF [Aeoliella mucimassa]